jgi:hypothetical protein
VHEKPPVESSKDDTPKAASVEKTLRDCRIVLNALEKSKTGGSGAAAA